MFINVEILYQALTETEEKRIAVCEEIGQLRHSYNKVDSIVYNMNGDEENYNETLDKLDTISDKLEEYETLNEDIEEYIDTLLYLIRQTRDLEKRV